MRRDYDFGSQLGRGSFGVVYKVRRKSDNGTFVCKQIQVQSMSKKAREEANQEVALLRRISKDSEYIVQYIAHFLDGDSLHIIMEFCAHGDLSQFLKARSSDTKPQLVKEQTVWKFLIQIGLGLRWLHSNRVLHRDIKTLNVFLTSANDVRLGDLGVARVLSQNTKFADTFVGTPYYLSPELCEEKPYNELSDVWAFGCVVYEMCTLKHPFSAKNHAALLIKILRAYYAPIEADYSDDLRNLIDCCMHRDWQKRLKLVDLLAGASVRSRADSLGLALDGSGSGVKAGAPAASEEPKRAIARAGSKPAASDDGAPKVQAAAAPSAAVAGAGGMAAVGRRSAEKFAPGRARDRRVGDKRAAGGRRALAEEKLGGACAPSTTIVAPASSRAAAQVIRSAPGARGGAAPPGRPPAAAAYPGAPGPAVSRAYGGCPPAPSPEANAGGPPRRLTRDTAEMRRKARQEVADLPDVVVPRPRSGRNVPSVHMMQLEPEPTGSAFSSSRSSPVMFEGTTNLRDAETVLRQAAELTRGPDALAEATLQPMDMDDATLLPRRQEDASEDVPEEVPEEDEEYAEDYEDFDDERYDDDEEVDEVQNDCEEEEEENDGAVPPGLRLLQPLSAEPLPQGLRLLQPLGSGGEGAAELTQVSAFGDSLAFTMEDTDVSRLKSTATQPVEDVCVEWRLGAEGAEEDAAQEFPGSLHLTAKLDSDGLLCDARWHEPTDAQPVDDEGAQATSSAPASARIPGAVAVPELVASLGRANVSEVRPAATAAEREAAELAAAERAATKAADRAAAKVVKLTSQIDRLYKDVVRDLDAPARKVWEELYVLFQEKMAIDLTDEDQSDIERYVFEQLPTESTDMIWKVYKVLHLEQERDRFQRMLVG